MQSLAVYTGNRLDILADALADVLRTPPRSPFDPEIVIVHSKGMERWVSMQIAHRLGICANYRFPFPNAFLAEVARRIIPELPGSSLFDPRFSTWKIMHLIPQLLQRKEFEDLRHYLNAPDGKLKQLQLSKRIAEAFDQYVMYRPELIFRWEAGEEKHWQATLWRELAKGHEREHVAAWGKELLERLKKAAPGEFDLPARASIFGISYLPPFHMHILERLSKLMEIHLFLLNPCREYWGDIPSNRDIQRLTAATRPREASPEELHLEIPNSLLASMGTMGRDFFDLLTTFNYSEQTFFHDPGERHLLACIQSDILNLRESGRNRPKKTVSEEDSSIQIHVCHSEMREVEVLYDYLLEMFEKDPDLLPKDILVMAPDIESYTPFIQAVFDTPEEERKRIPYGIADRSMRKESPLVDTFLALLDLKGERAAASRVLTILEAPPVRNKFGFTDSDLDLITQWVQDVRIKWGIDEEDRLRWQPEPLRDNTWMAGMERLLLGYAMPGRDAALFCGILPYDHVEGSHAAVLGNFLEFLERLFTILRTLHEPRSLSLWSDTLSETLSVFFLPDEDSRNDLNALRLVLTELKTIEELSDYHEAVDLDLIKWHLGKHLSLEGFGHGFMTGGVTFCSMLPMRSIPFKVICLIGMDGDAFPRQSKPPEFDLISRHPKPGDRSVRHDDRYLFLEALLSAQEKLYISYTGQSCQDNTAIPPSVLVSELSDYINRNFKLSDREEPDWFVTRHRLQSFNPVYFTGSGDLRLFSYSSEHAAEAECLLAEKLQPVPFIAGELSPPDEALKAVSLSDLCRFFRNPAKFLLNARLGIDLSQERRILEDAECFALDPLEKYSLEGSLVECRISGKDPADLFPLVRASGRLPHGIPGLCTFKDLCRQVESFVKKTEPFLQERKLEPLDVDFPVGEFRVTGRIHPIYPKNLVRYRSASIKGKDLLNLWILHLAMNHAGAPGYPAKSILIGREKGKWEGREFQPVGNGKEVLQGLLELYWEGLRRPLHLFPESSLKYAEQVVGGKSRDYALNQARSLWLANGYDKGAESLEPHVQMCFQYVDPFDTDFERVSLAVFKPLLENLGDCDL